MKFLSSLLVALVCTATIALAQNSNIENQIRELEKAEANAVLNRDSSKLESIWAEAFTVNTPYNTIGTRKRGDAINLHYSRFDRNIEKILISSDHTVITMGNEVIVRKPPMTNAGQVMTRRFTHTWIKTNDKWQIIARHANFICDDTPKKQIQ